MFIRIALLVVLAPAVARCATNYTGIGRDQSLDTLRTQNVGLVLIHTALNNQHCTRVLAQPIAKFSVHAGEFVDVGSLQLPTRTTGTFFRTGEFNAYVVPSDEAVIQTLAAKRPEIYAHLVRRLMTIPGQQQEPGQIVAPQAAH
ncbi:MAG TPA: hypothetical protein VGG01_09975 [Xanthobacteraceae bacterium]|jgi:hypothetical protein